MSFSLNQTEKSYNLQSQQFFTLSSYQKFNKIELKKILVQNGLKVVKITTVNPYSKQKRRANRLVRVQKPFKYYIKLQGGLLNEDTLEKINQYLNSSK